jgi:NAD(P)-dependent dehydrogenase (short-subunit alcohol dehydrogenase family)
VSARFQNKVVVITGASSGIGRETALAFAQAGARVVLAARYELALHEVANEIVGKIGFSPMTASDCVLVVRTDVTRDEDVRQLAATVVERFGRVDILINNAGVGMRALVADMPLDDVHHLMEVNFYGPLRCIQAVLPYMRKQGTGQIVNIGSVLSMIVAPRNGAYCASKFGLLALSDSLRIELQGAGINVISVLPAYTDTPFFEHMFRYGSPTRISPFKGQDPAKVAQAILRACARRRRQVVLTFSAQLGIWLRRLAPGLLDFAVRRFYQRAAKADSKTR